MANKKNDPNHLGFGRLMAWKSSDIAMAGLNVIVLGYLSIYCSDTLGIAPAVVGTVLMVSKIIDAFTDIFAGWLVDNTHTKLGKGRPYELAIVGVMLCSLGLFSGSPAWSNTLKVVWIFCMYTLVFSIFTTLRGAANTPYTIRHFSNNPILIRKVASYGGIITMAGSMIVPHRNEQAGHQRRRLAYHCGNLCPSPAADFSAAFLLLQGGPQRGRR
jgi:Na+/melibiose symporter-like transporter